MRNIFFYPVLCAAGLLAALAVVLSLFLHVDASGVALLAAVILDVCLDLKGGGR